MVTMATGDTSAGTQTSRSSIQHLGFVCYVWLHILKQDSDCSAPLEWVCWAVEEGGRVTLTDENIVHQHFFSFYIFAPGV
jgi:hypothetical protein